MGDAWQNYFDDAMLLRGDRRHRRLGTMCVAADSIVRHQANASLGLPPSRASTGLVRQAGEILLREADSDVVLTMGLVFRNWKRERFEPEDAQHWRDLADAQLASRRTGNELLTAWVEYVTAFQLISTQRALDSLPHSENAAVFFEADRVAGLGPYAAAEEVWPESRDERKALTAIGYFAWSTVGKSRRYTGDVVGWQQALQHGCEIARRSFEYRPSLLAASLTGVCNFQRSLGEQADLTELEKIRFASAATEVTYLTQVAENAAARGDRAAALEVQRERIDFLLGRRHAHLVDARPRRLSEYFAGLSEPERRVENSLANASYEMATNLMESGRAWADAEGLRLTLDWMDVADSIWAGWAINGVRAVLVRRSALLLAEHPESVFDLISVAQEAPRPGLREVAITSATADTSSYRAEVLAQVNAMLDEPWNARQKAGLLADRAWLTRPGEALQNDQSSIDATEALELLSNRPPSALRHVARSAQVLVSWGALRKDRAAQRSALTEELLAVGRMLLNASTAEQRMHTARLWSGTIHRALSFAESNNDAALADLAAEIVRRDGIATLLAAAGADPLTPDLVAESVQRANAAGTTDGESLIATSETAASAPESDEFGDQRARDAGDTLIAERDVAAYRQAESLLGSLGSLIDPGTLYAAKAADVLGLVPNTRPTYILQLLPSTLPMVGEDRRPVLHRRLTWRHEDAAGSTSTAEIVDTVSLAPGLLAEPEPNDLGAWSDATPFFPQPLLDALEGASREAPIRLLIVPTGLFHIQFDSLSLPRGRLIEFAVTSVHTSLTSIEHSLSHLSDRAVAGSLAALDTVRLPATEAERAALDTNFPHVVELKTKAELRASATAGTSAALLALAVHGGDDDDGWSQYKFLPSGETLTAAEVLGFWFPELCVLASCHSRVRISGTDHAGFPTALFARGARTIIGSIGRLFDNETASILSAFYDDLRLTGNPVESLRAARLTWIDESPRLRWASPEYWGRLVAYGGAHF